MVKIIQTHYQHNYQNIGLFIHRDLIIPCAFYNNLCTSGKPIKEVYLKIHRIKFRANAKIGSILFLSTCLLLIYTSFLSNIPLSSKYYKNVLYNNRQFIQNIHTGQLNV